MIESKFDIFLSKDDELWLITTLDIIFQISKTTVTLQIFEYFVRKFRLDIVMYQTGDVVRDLNFSQNAFLESSVKKAMFLQK